MKSEWMAQESERARISQELHDNIGQGVLSIFLGLQSLKPCIQDETYRRHLLNMEKMLEETLDDIKKLSKDLMSSMLEHLGLEKTLQHFVRE